MAQDALFQTEQGIDPRESKDAAWSYLEQLRDPRRGAGLDEEPFAVVRPNWANPSGYHFSPRPDHRTLRAW